MCQKIALLAALAVAAGSMPSTNAWGTARAISVRSICGGGDNSVPVKCFANSTLAETLPLAYERARPIARLYTRSSNICTGFLIGSEGHLLTSANCIDGASDASAVDYEFEAESASCADECKQQFGCKGAVVATAAEFITSSWSPVYSIVKLPASVDLTKYGYLQLRSGGPVVGEKIYVPQHPLGFAKRIAAYTEGNQPASILSIGRTDLCDQNGFGHAADTQGGSSGAPVLSWADNLVVGVHNCGGCTSSGDENGGINARDILADLAAKNIVIKDLVYVATTAPAPTTTAPPPTTTAPPPTTTAPPPTTTAPPPTTTAPPPTTTSPPPTTTAPPPTTTAPPPTTTTPPPTTTTPLPTTTAPPSTTAPPAPTTRAPGYCS